MNDAKVTNTRLGQASDRLEAQATKEQDVAARHAQRLADNEHNRQSRERVANTPRVSHQFRTSTIRHESAKPKVKVVLKDKYLGKVQ